MISQKIVVRRYKPQDSQALADIYYNTIHQINIQDYTEEQVKAWAPETSLESGGWEKKFEKTEPLVALMDDIIVGFVEFELNGHIDCFYCHHKYIGRGVGATLMASVFQIAIEKEIKHIFAEVSITARPFFEKQGFTVATEQTVVFRGVEFVNYKMEKYLPDA